MKFTTMKADMMARPLGMIVLLAAASFGNPAFAQQRPGTAASSAVAAPSSDQIRQRAAKIKEARALLSDPEPTVRMAAFDQYTSSNDTVLQEVAYEVGFSSGDASMRSLALRRRLVHMQTFTMEITDVISDSRLADRNAAPAQVGLKVVTMLVAGADERSGVVYISDHPVSEATARQSGANITVAGLTVTVNGKSAYPGCAGTMRLDDSNVLVGVMVCANIPTSTGQPVSLKMRTSVT